MEVTPPYLRNLQITSGFYRFGYLHYIHNLYTYSLKESSFMKYLPSPCACLDGFPHWAAMQKSS